MLEFLRALLNTYRFIKGYLVFLVIGTPPADARLGLKHLSNLTNGRVNDALVALTRLRYPPPPAAPARGVLGDLSTVDVQRIADRITELGYHVFESRLPEAVCNDLMRFAKSTPCNPMNMDARDTLDHFEHVAHQPVIYQAESPISARYNFDQQVVAENPHVQRLIIDPTLLAIAGRYLGTEPINDMTTMWWSTAMRPGRGSSAAAQFYHCDMDRIRFIKFFFYLTDVDVSTGPHCLVASSHRRKPRALLRGSRRIGDEELARYYPAEQILEICGPRGTILAVDNAGFHKGKPLVCGDRLILQVLYATSRFGAVYAPIKVNDHFTPAFLDLARQRPRVLENFDFSARG